MSRTLRKQSGDRYWRSAHRSKYNFTRGGLKRFSCIRSPVIPMSWDEVEKEMQTDIVNHEKKDGHWMCTINRSVKWHSNMMVRSCNRRELQRVLKDPENYDYNHDHDLRKKGIWWIYD